MPEMPDVVSGEAVAADWGNDIRDRTVQRYADATARDAAMPFPLAGDLAYLDDSGTVTLFDGTQWRSGSAEGVYVRLIGDTMTGELRLPSLAIPVDSGGTATFGPDPSTPERLRIRFGGSSPSLSTGLSLQYTGDSERILLDVAGTRILVGGLPVFAGQSTFMGVGRGTVAPPGFDTQWTAVPAVTFTFPAHWGTCDIMATGGIQVAGGTANYQVRSRLNINGNAGAWNQSGNSSQAPSAISSASHIRSNLSGDLTISLEAILDDTGGTAATVTKYAHLEYTAVRKT